MLPFSPLVCYVEGMLQKVLITCRLLSSVCLWIRIFMEASLSWASPVLCNTLLCERFKFLGDKKRVVVFGSCGMIVIFWVVWVEVIGGH